MSPAGLTLRELTAIARGRNRALWDQIVWTLAPHLPKGTNPNDLNPYRKSRRDRSTLTVAELYRWREEVTPQ